MRTFAATNLGSAVFRPTAHHLDRFASKLTGGKRSFAGLVTGVPAVTLTTTGAKSGEPRSVAVYGIPHPDGLAVIASNWGGAKHPAWYHNLKANPAITVETGPLGTAFPTATAAAGSLLVCAKRNEPPSTLPGMKFIAGLPTNDATNWFAGRW